MGLGSPFDRAGKLQGFLALNLWRATLDLSVAQGRVGKHTPSGRGPQFQVYGRHCLAAGLNLLRASSGQARVSSW